MNIDKWLALAVVVIIVVATVATYYSNVPHARNPTNVLVGWAGSMNEAPTIIALANRYFSDEGLNSMS